MKYDVLNPRELTNPEWRTVTSIARLAFFNGLPGRSLDQIDHMMEFLDFDNYAEACKDPNLAMNFEFNDERTYFDPKIALAKNGRDIIGFAYAAQYVTGGKLAQIKKRRNAKERFLWLPRTAVHPGFQGAGVAKELGQHLLNESGSLEQPVSTVVWPKELPRAYKTLTNLCFEEQGRTSTLQAFGPDAAPIEQVTMVAPSVAVVQARLSQQ